MKEYEMDGDIAKLIQLLKKILKTHPDGTELAKFMDQKSFNLNLCFLTFVPMTPEELEQLEDMYEEYLSRGDEALEAPKKRVSKLEFKLSQEDVKFLKQNGIRF